MCLLCVLRGALGPPRGRDIYCIVYQPFDWQLLSAEKHFTVLLV